MGPRGLCSEIVQPIGALADSDSCAVDSSKVRLQVSRPGTGKGTRLALAWLLDRVCVRKWAVIFLDVLVL